MHFTNYLRLVLCLSCAGIVAAPPAGRSAEAVASSGEEYLDVDSFRAKFEKCWRLPEEFESGSYQIIGVIISLNIDGTLAGPIEFMEETKPLLKGDGPNKWAVAAIEAVEKCAPYKLPPESYEYWKKLELLFDPGMSKQ